MPRGAESPVSLPSLVIVTVLAFNFIADGLRDAADPLREMSACNALTTDQRRD